MALLRGRRGGLDVTLSPGALNQEFAELHARLTEQPGFYRGASAIVNFGSDLPSEEELARLTSLLGLGEFLKQRAGTLSTGQRQRVSLGRALIHRPPVMLLDEPTLGLDVLGSQVIIEYIELLRNEGKAVILTTHHLDDAERLCTRFGLLHHGRLVSEGTLAELRARTGCTSLIDMFLTLAHTGPALAAVPGDAPV